MELVLCTLTVKLTNHLVPSIAAFPTWNCEYPQSGAEIVKSTSSIREGLARVVNGCK